MNTGTIIVTGDKSNTIEEAYTNYIYAPKSHVKYCEMKLELKLRNERLSCSAAV
jgi:hypothetical protein